MSNISENLEQEFVLKHRVAGAAVLLVFGVLFLPWLLGPPALVDSNVKLDVSASKLRSNEALDNKQTQNLTSDQVYITDNAGDMLVETISKGVIEEDKVYISKITPLDSGGVQNDIKPKIVEQNEEHAIISAPQASANADTKENVGAGLGQAKQILTQKTPKAETAASNVNAKVDLKTIKIGWIVSVGVFSSINNVAAVKKDLFDKGFHPSVSEIDTNKGKATRVWLGPFESRVEAAKMKMQLKEKTGEPGLIKVYP